MAELRETSLTHVSGDDFAVVYTGERKWINHLKRLAAERPDDVEITTQNNDGSIIAKIPIDWFRIKPKKIVNLTPEQIEASKARLEDGRLKRLKMLKEDAYKRELGKD